MVRDAETERSVVAALLSDKRLQEAALEVIVRAGVVYLCGRVHSALERRLARQAAESVSGVRAVVNELALRATGGRSDRDVKAAVHGALASDLRAHA